MAASPEGFLREARWFRGSVALNWIVPADAVAGRNRMRLRTAAEASRTATAIATASGGEVEGYAIRASMPAIAACSSGSLNMRVGSVPRNEKIQGVTP